MLQNKKQSNLCQFLPPGSSIGPNVLQNFYSVKNHKIVNNSTTTESREK
jgi:hypothetical protein